MAKFQSVKFDVDKINNGMRFENGDGISAEAINAPIEAALYAQEKVKVLEDIDFTKLGGSKYLGTADSVEKLNSYTYAQTGDYVRANAAFTYNEEQVHSSDLLIYTGSAWDVIHSEDTANFAKLDENNKFAESQTISNDLGETTYSVGYIDSNPNAGVFNIRGGKYGGVGITSKNAESQANSHGLILREDTIQSTMAGKSYGGGYSILQFTEPKGGSATVKMPDHSGTIALTEDLPEAVVVDNRRVSIINAYSYIKFTKTKGGSDFAMSIPIGLIICYEKNGRSKINYMHSAFTVTYTQDNESALKIYYDTSDGLADKDRFIIKPYTYSGYNKDWYLFCTIQAGLPAGHADACDIGVPYYLNGKLFGLDIQLTTDKISENRLVLDTNTNTSSIFIEPLVDRTFAFPPDSITVECCRVDEQDSDGNDVWLDYFEDGGISEEVKINQLLNLTANKFEYSSNFIVGGISRRGAMLGEDGTYTYKGKIGDKLRFTFDFQDSNLYFTSNALYTMVSEDGYKATLKIEVTQPASNTGGNYDVADNTFIVHDDNLPVSGWPGTNSYRLGITFGGYNPWRSRKLRVTYTISAVGAASSDVTETTSGFSVRGLSVYSKTFWSAPTLYTKKGYPYKLAPYGEHNAIFENDVYINNTTDGNKLLRHDKVFKNDVTVDGAWTFSKALYSYNGYKLEDGTRIGTSTVNDLVFFRTRNEGIGLHCTEGNDKGLVTLSTDGTKKIYTLPQNADTLVGKSDISDYMSIGDSDYNDIYSHNYFHRKPHFYDGIGFHKNDFGGGVPDSTIDVDGIKLYNNETLPTIMLGNHVDMGSHIEITKDYIETTINDSRLTAERDNDGNVRIRRYFYPESSGTIQLRERIQWYEAGDYEFGVNPDFEDEILTNGHYNSPGYSNIDTYLLQAPDNIYKIKLTPIDIVNFDDNPLYFTIGRLDFRGQVRELEIYFQPRTNDYSPYELAYIKVFSTDGLEQWYAGDNVDLQGGLYMLHLGAIGRFAVEFTCYTDDNLVEKSQEEE